MASDGKKHEPVVKAHAHRNYQEKHRDDLIKKFSTNFRKHLESRENLVTPHNRGVSFNPEVVETSFGGTSTPNKLKDISVHLDFTAVDERLKREEEAKKREMLEKKDKVKDKEKESQNKNENCSAKPSKPCPAIKNGLSSAVSTSKSQSESRVPKSTADSSKTGPKANNLQPKHPKVKINEPPVQTKPVTPIHKGRPRGSTPTKTTKDSAEKVTKLGETTPRVTSSKSQVNCTPQNKLKDNLLNGSLNHSSVNNSFLTPDRRHTMDLFKENHATPDCFNPVSFETPVPRSKGRWSSGDVHGRREGEEDSCSMTVAVRVRPFSTREETQEGCKCAVSMIDNETVVSGDKNDEHRFAYDYSFWSFDKKGGEFANQEHVYGALAQPLLAKAFEGYNTCLFAYGQTGSGKSYSIMGHGKEVGIIPRFCEELFLRINAGVEGVSDTNVEISFFEIYNEKIHDLLGPSSKDKTGKRPHLKVREHPVLGPYVEGLSSYVVKSFEDIESWLNVGNKHRATAATGMNDKSSRSHSVFTIVMTQTRLDVIEGVDHEHSITSKINLVDLAGSERQSLAKTSGDRLREGASINKSLHTLGKVISLLSDRSMISMKKKKIFIPYRDSVLTWLLKESLGGNSRTAMLATISPAALHMEETLSTLRYAHQAKNIINQAKVNEDPKARLIRELKAEIERLKNQSSGGVSDNDLVGASLAEIASLKSKLQLKELEMNEMTKSWQERLEKSEQRRNEESRILEKSGIALQIDNKLPNLVNLNEDPQLSEMLLYVLKQGESRVGRMVDKSAADIQLNGPLIADSHCIINNGGKRVVITPLGDAPTYVNGDIITKATTLHHGDRVILGGDHYFRFNHPLEVAQGRKSTSHTKDFEFARQELIRVQNARLEAELDCARRRHEEELAAQLAKQRSAAEQHMQRAVEQTKQEADARLNMQRTEYEDRLADLEGLLNEHKSKKYESEQQKKQMETVVKKLEQQKMMLENEVLANRKRLQLEAQAAQKSVAQSRIAHSKIVEHLEKESQKIKEDVARLEERRQRNRTANNTPRCTPRPATADSSRTDLYKTALLVREANKISQHLHKNTVFSREDVQDEEEGQTVVKVTNTKLGISTFWTMAKFEDRLLQMREMYQGDSEHNMDGDVDVFYDPNDTWEKDDRLASSPAGISPVIIKNLKRQTTPRESLPMRLSFASTPGSANTPRSRINNGSVSSLKDIVEDEPASQPVIGMCRDMISCTIEQYSGVVLKETVADKLLHACETVKSAVTAMLEAYISATEEGESKSEFVDSELVRGCSVQLAHGIGLLLSHCAVWKSQYEADDSPSIIDLFDTIIATVKNIGNKMVLFLQGCENDIDSMVKESGNQVLDGLYSLCKLCGEVALATATPAVSMRDTWDDTLTQIDQQVPPCKLGHDVRQFFLCGCDTYIDKSLQGGLKAIEGCNNRVITMVDKESSKDLSDVLKCVELAVVSSRILLEKLQEVQVQLDTTMRESSSEQRVENFYHRNYQRCQGLVTHVSNLADGIALLTQATEALAADDDGALRRLYRCAEMIQKSTLKILATSLGDTSSSSLSLLTDSQSDHDASLLSDSQLQELDFAGQEIKLATNSLILAIKKEIDEKGPGCKLTRSPSKTKRMLPLSPKKGSPKYGKGKTNTALVDLAAASAER